jgi:hypothetical protein
MAIHTELNLRLPNSPGALGSLCRLLADERVDITALALDGNGQLRLVVNNHVRGAAVLREHRHQVAERPVLVTSVPGGPGSLAAVLELLGEAGVNLDYAYGTSEGRGSAAIVLGVADTIRAAAAAGL